MHLILFCATKAIFSCWDILGQYRQAWPCSWQSSHVPLKYRPPLPNGCIPPPTNPSEVPSSFQSFHGSHSAPLFDSELEFWAFSVTCSVDTSPMIIPEVFRVELRALVVALHRAVLGY